MNLEKVVFGFFVLLAATLNFGYVTGDLGNPEHHNVLELYAAVIVNIIAAILKFGDRTQIGAIHLAASLVATIQLLAAAMAWIWYTQITLVPMTTHNMASVVSLALGALLANVVSVVLMIIETANFRRH
ncbi:MAG TPA: hypothetical protein GXZ45_07865 [Propionibacterium sp.]|nr:hypothetical protein [Propionibacterium sp.]